MFISTFRKLHPFRNPAFKASGDDILKTQDFISAVNREWARAERYNLSFSVIVFDATRCRNHCPEFADSLVRAILSRIRPTDEIGVIDDHRIAILCAETPPEGAGKLLDDILEKLPAGHPAPEHAIYVRSAPQKGVDDLALQAAEENNGSHRQGDLPRENRTLQQRRLDREHSREGDRPLFSRLDKVGGV
jgi:hypothetical protein